MHGAIAEVLYLEGPHLGGLTGSRLGALYYRANPSIRNSQFPIWAKGKGVLGPSKPPFLRNIPLSKADFVTMARL